MNPDSVYFILSRIERHVAPGVVPGVALCIATCVHTGYYLAFLFTVYFDNPW